jgi:hypothetical protein
MKKLTVIFTLLFSTVMFSSPSYAEWTKVGENAAKIQYVDFERIRNHDGYIYFWQLQDYLKPTKYGILSRKIYNQGDCKLFRYKSLSSVVHKQPMGRGWWRTSPKKKPEWKYPSPDTVIEVVLQEVCRRRVK